MFNRYRAHLETELVKQELLLKFVISDKDKTIHRLEEEVKWLRARLDLALTPAQRAERSDFKMPKTAPEGETSWQAYLNRYIAEEEAAERAEREKANGVHVEVRTAVHESASSDAQRPNGGTATIETSTAKTSA